MAKVFEIKGEYQNNGLVAGFKGLTFHGFFEMDANRQFGVKSDTEGNAYEWFHFVKGMQTYKGINQCRELCMGLMKFTNYGDTRELLYKSVGKTGMAPILSKIDVTDNLEDGVPLDLYGEWNFAGAGADLSQTMFVSKFVELEKNMQPNQDARHFMEAGYAEYSRDAELPPMVVAFRDQYNNFKAAAKEGRKAHKPDAQIADNLLTIVGSRL